MNTFDINRWLAESFEDAPSRWSYLDGNEYPRSLVLKGPISKPILYPHPSPGEISLSDTDCTETSAVHDEDQCIAKLDGLKVSNPFEDERCISPPTPDTWLPAPGGSGKYGGSHVDELSMTSGGLKRANSALSPPNNKRSKSVDTSISSNSVPAWRRGKRYACPFAKRYPVRYYPVMNSCTASKGLGSGFKRVKEHVKNVHTQFACENCHARFKSNKDLDKHASDKCEWRDPLFRPDPMTKLQAERVLNLKADRNKTDVDNYRAFYHALFPEDPKWETINPDYDYNVAQHTLNGSALQDFQESDGPSSAVPRKSPAPVLSPIQDNTADQLLFPWGYDQENRLAEHRESYHFDDDHQWSDVRANAILDDLRKDEVERENPEAEHHESYYLNVDHEWSKFFEDGALDEPDKDETL
ncbi:MAG: hypothetical protein M1821_007064 [Bathelium mastoideum]|nr:MAG: hypothetical protein M1821_007064 [Bathelium mastoideum]